MGCVCAKSDLIHRTEYLQLWWQIFVEHVEPHLGSSIVSASVCSFFKIICQQFCCCFLIYLIDSSLDNYYSLLILKAYHDSSYQEW